LLYVARNEYIYLPINAFESLDDIDWFEKEIVSQIKK